jgi:N-acetylmuramoyl-L-alanine amidase
VSLHIRDHPSPNATDRPASQRVDTLVLHGGAPTGSASAHYVVETDGTIWRLVDESRAALHAGSGVWRARRALDGRSIGIAVVGSPGRFAPEYPVLQLSVLCDLCLEVLSRHAIAARDIVGHSDIAPDRAEDPGEGFDWEGLARNGVGLWPEGAPDLGTGGTVRDAASLRDVRAALGDIGYRVAPQGGFDPALGAVLRAFQRHWRPEAVNGQADAGTLGRLLAVARAAGDEDEARSSAG